MTVIIFLIVLAVLIFVHELGHFLLARAFGIRVDAFKIGFGPKIVAWKRGETEYGVNWIPFGGYVKIHGEDPNDENTYGPDAARSFVNKPRWQQVIVLVAGVTFNFIFAWLLYIGIFATGVTVPVEDFQKYSDRYYDPRIMVVGISEGSPAEAAGLKDGDVIVSVEGLESVEIESIQNTINNSRGESVSLDYLREDQLWTIEIIPSDDIVEGKYAIGIAMRDVVDMRLTFFMAVSEASKYTPLLIRDTSVGLYKFVSGVFRGEADFDDVSGPVGIAIHVGDAANRGFTSLLMITAIISISLGVINLVPFPALDGGRVLFVLIEGLIRRRITPRFTNAVNLVGFALLMLLMVAVTYKDIARLVR